MYCGRKNPISTHNCVFMQDERPDSSASAAAHSLADRPQGDAAAIAREQNQEQEGSGKIEEPPRPPSECARHPSSVVQSSRRMPALHKRFPSSLCAATSTVIALTDNDHMRLLQAARDGWMVKQATMMLPLCLLQARARKSASTPPSCGARIPKCSVLATCLMPPPAPG